MPHMKGGESVSLDLNDKNGLRQKIADVEWVFTHAELQTIIRNEFFNDENELDGGLVDAALARLLLLDGIDINAQTLQRERERMIYSVIRQILRSGQ